MDVMAIRRGLMMAMAGTVSDNKHLECGSFTLAEEAKTYTINHGLEAVPDFCIVYPISVPKTQNTYCISWQVIVGNIGQEDWNVTQKNQTDGAVRTCWFGSNYSNTVDSAQLAYNKGVTSSGGVNYAGVATTTTYVVGAYDGTNAAGTLLPGTYGYILGKLNN